MGGNGVKWGINGEMQYCKQRTNYQTKLKNDGEMGERGGGLVNPLRVRIPFPPFFRRNMSSPLRMALLKKLLSITHRWGENG